MTITVYYVDAFTAEPFAGNPAAVCQLPGAAEEQWMRLVTRELNQPVTAFVHPIDDDFGLRWFTPKTELDMCGHGTLAAAHVLAECDRLGPNGQARFHTGGGPLKVEREGDLMVLDFPAIPFQPEAAPAELLAALGVSPVDAGRFGEKRLLAVSSERELHALTPDFLALRALPERAVVVTCRSESPGIDFVSRNFIPWVGIDEDAVTGSSHCGLGPYWAERLGKQTMTAIQASARGGRLQVEVAGTRVRIGGQATTVASGKLRV